MFCLLDDDVFDDIDEVDIYSDDDTNILVKVISF